MHVLSPVPDPCDAQPDLPPAARALIMRGLAKEPEDRLPSAAAMADTPARVRGPAGRPPLDAGAAVTPVAAPPMPEPSPAVWSGIRLRRSSRPHADLRPARGAPRRPPPAGRSALPAWALALNGASGDDLRLRLDESDPELRQSADGQGDLDHRSGRVDLDGVPDGRRAHTHVGDLVIDLIAPSGRPERIWSFESGADVDLALDLYQSDPELAGFVGKEAGGAWRLSRSDRGPGDVGTLDRWSLRITGE